MLVNRSVHSLWRAMTDDQQIGTSRGSSACASVVPIHHSSEILSSQSMKINEKVNTRELCLSFVADTDNDDINGDFLSSDYQIDRKQIHMIESLGNGQFGEVYRGILKVIWIFSTFLLFCHCTLDGSTNRNQYSDKNM